MREFYFHEELRGAGVSEPLGEERHKKGHTHSTIYFWENFVSLGMKKLMIFISLIVVDLPVNSYGCEEPEADCDF